MTPSRSKKYVRKPGIVDPDPAAKGAKQRDQGLGEIAIADQADIGVIEAVGMLVAADAVGFGSVAKGLAGFDRAAA